ncbi:carboxypeptidase C [Malassezia psittaci]|uniref:Carboxypeptidase n=1 Tax=Malassezia psittaci TaxID=1821823 RepID=A0AAF0JEC2_9BASI|nr:carboxypeptidase C [Malassezia psittaci]
MVFAKQAPFKLPTSDTVTQDDFRVLSHPSLPAHSLRLRRVPDGICERKGTASWSGYLDVDLDVLYEQEDQVKDLSSKNRTHAGIVEHFYFWAFESRNNKFTDPVTLWLNGGPGCSSFTGLLMELGPCNAAPPKNGVPHTEWNPHAWNANSSMIFLDQPTGTGFSYTSWKNTSREDAPPSRVFDTAHAARDVSAFLHLLATDSVNEVMSIKTLPGSPLPQFKEFHMAGESYAGRYLPLIASQLVKDNERLLAHPESGLLPIPLKSVLIGNGVTSPKHQNKAFVQYACTNVTGDGPFLSKRTCDKMWKDLPTCQKMTEKCNKHPGNVPYSREACVNALSFCNGALSSPWDATNSSYFDYQHKKDYDEEAYVAALLNHNETRAALGIDARGAGDRHDGKFVGCSDRVYADFESTGDGSRESTWAVRDVLSKGVRVMSYSGTRDFICNYLGNGQWTYDLDWANGDEFRNSPLEPWYVEGVKGPAGHFRNFGNLTFATVNNAGHFVPYDQPIAAQSMFTRWEHGAVKGRLD